MEEIFTMIVGEAFDARLWMQFGMTVIAVALVADYTVTPALIFLAKPFGKEKNEANTN